MLLIIEHQYFLEKDKTKIESKAKNCIYKYAVFFIFYFFEYIFYLVNTDEISLLFKAQRLRRNWQ